jgi:tyrosyl-tRNA synthetase
MAQLLKQANLCASTSEAMRMVEQGGVRVDGTVISDKALNCEPAPSCCKSASASSRA